jgi:Notch-like protein
MSWPAYFIDIYECFNNNCTNGATCKDGVNGYTCTCMSGYTGTYCEIGL